MHCGHLILLLQNFGTTSKELVIQEKTPRLILTATNVQTGEAVIFDSNYIAALIPPTDYHFLSRPKGRKLLKGFHIVEIPNCKGKCYESNSY